MRQLGILFFILFYFPFLWEISNARADAIVLGAGLHAGQSKVKADRAFLFLGAGGFNTFRDEVYWSHVESERGVLGIGIRDHEVDRLMREGLSRAQKPLIVLGYGNKAYDDGDIPRTDDGRAAFSRYCSFIASRYAGKVEFFEIWNEWNAAMGSKARPRAKGTAESYVQLSKACLKEIKKHAPTAKVLVGGTAGYDGAWTDAAIAQGVLAGADGFSIHPYVFLHHSDRSPEKAVSGLRHLEEKLERAAKNSKESPVPIYVTEIGWPTNQGLYGIPDDVAADYLVRFLFLARTVALVKGVWLYEMFDGGGNPTNKEHRFGLIRRDLSVKPAFLKVKAVSNAIRTGVLRGFSGEAGTARWVQLTLPDGHEVSALWGAGGGVGHFRMNIAKGEVPKVLVGDEAFRDGDNTVKVNGSPLVLIHLSGKIHIEALN